MWPCAVYTASVTAAAAAKWEGRQAQSGLGGLDSGSTGKWLISKWKIVEALVAVLAWLPHKQLLILKRKQSKDQTKNSDEATLISCDRGLTDCLLKQCLVYIRSCNNFRFDAVVFNGTLKLCWGWTVWGRAFTFYSQSIMKMVRWIQMHLHTDNTVRFSFKCMAASGSVQEQPQSPSEHTAALSPRRFITDLHYTV